MGAQMTSCKDTIELTQEKVLSIVCCRGKGSQSGSISTGKHRYGSLAGKYDESDDEDVKGMLYPNNLLLDDDDDEEEQIVIITKEKPAKAEQRKQGAPALAVDHSVFQDGQGLLDMSAKSVDTPSPASSSSNYDQVMHRMNMEQKNEQAVNEVMEEIEDQLDSDEDDTAFLVTTNSGTGGNEPETAYQQQQQDQQQQYSKQQNNNTNELEQFGLLDDGQQYQQQTTTAQDNAAAYQDYNHQGSNSAPQQQQYDQYAHQNQQQQYNDYSEQQAYSGYNQGADSAVNGNKYAQYDVDGQQQHDQNWNQNDQQNNNNNNWQQQYDQQQQINYESGYGAAADQHQYQEAEDLMAELDDAVCSDDEGLI